MDTYIQFVKNQNRQKLNRPLFNKLYAEIRTEYKSYLKECELDESFKVAIPSFFYWQHCTYRRYKNHIKVLFYFKDCKLKKDKLDIFATKYLNIKKTLAKEF